MGVQAYVLVRSPLVLILRLQPACLANACSMWSRNPIPVHIQMCWCSVICDAWVSSVCGGMAGVEVFGDVEVLESGKCSESGSRSSGPPSKERETWILVSLVFLLMKAVRLVPESTIRGVQGRWMEFRCKSQCLSRINASSVGMVQGY